MQIVGAVAYSSEEAQDDVDVQRDGGALFTPALTRLLARCCAAFAETAVQLRPGVTVASAEAAIQDLLPKGFPIEFYVAGQTEARAARAAEPSCLALAVFGGIAALAALVIGGQLIGRQLRRDSADLAALRALGAGPAATTADGLPGVLGAIGAGAVLAAAVAAALSPLAPLGAVRAVYPDPGVAFDWTVLGGGAAAIVAALSAVALAIAARRAPHRAAAGGRPSGSVGSRAARRARALGLPVPAAEGVRLALDPGPGRDRAAVRPAILGTARIDGQTVPVIGAGPDAAVGPPVLSGHPLDSAGQLVLGPQTLAALGKRVGDTVTVSDGAERPYRLRIAGTATLPALGIASTLHTEMGTGADRPYQDIPGAAAAEPNAILVSLRPGADLALLKTLGFTRRQLAATVAWQATAAVAVGAIAGVPLGIVLGRCLWDRFATQISVVPDPSVPSARSSSWSSARWSRRTWSPCLPAGPRPGSRPRPSCAQSNRI